MKKILFTLFVLILAILWIGANHVLGLPSVQNKILSLVSQQTGTELKVSDLSFSFLNGVAVNLNDLNAKGRGAGSQPWELKAKRLTANFETVPLLTGKLKLKNLTVRGGAYTWKQPLEQGALELRVRDVAADLNDIYSPRGRFSLKAALFESTSQNLNVTGWVQNFGNPEKHLEIQAKTKIQFDPVDFNRLKQKVPHFRSLPLFGKAVKGVFEGELTSLSFLPQGGVSGIRGQWFLDLDEVRVQVFKKPLRRVKLTLKAEDQEIRFENGQAELGSGKLIFQGRYSDIFRRPLSKWKFDIAGLEADDLVPAKAPGSVRVFGLLQGHLNLDTENMGSGQPSLLRGDGQIQMPQGIVYNFNVLRKVFDQISRIPIIGTDISRHLSAKYQAYLQNPHMPVYNFQTQFLISPNGVQIREASVSSDHFALRGKGMVAPDLSLNMPGALYISPELSAELAGAWNDMAILADPYGQIVFPFFIRGTLQQPHVIPDTEYLMSRMVRAKGQELIGNLFEGGSQQGSSSNASDLIRQFL